jgi:metallo-beta-lactamase family protein
MLDTGGAKFLIDCGLFQGEHSIETNNWESFPFDPKKVAALINTHVHLDHIGRIPKLVRDGYRGPIISTAASKALAEPLLLDALELNRHEAQREGKEPLYDEADISQALTQWEGIDYHQVRDLGDGVTMELYNSGHILGSAMVRFARGDRSMIFTGDLGGGNSPLLPLAEHPTGAQYLLIESVYGDKKRDDTNRLERLETVIKDTMGRGGTLLIPAFSTERTQDLLFDIRELMLQKRIPSVPVYLDSPLAEKLTQAYLRFPHYFSDDIQRRITEGEHIFAFPGLHFIEYMHESQSVSAQPGPKILIAGSGMSNGGRVVSHEVAVLPDERSTVLVVGYQAAGSLGRRLIEGQKKVTIRGKTVPVHARVETMYGYSAHMDGEQLLEFVNTMSDSLAEVFVAMGEPASSSFLVQRIRDYLGLKASAPEVGQSAQIEL